MIKLELQEIEIPEPEEHKKEAQTRDNPKKWSVKPVEKQVLAEGDLYRIVEMAWQDRTHFDVIYRQFGLNENEVKKLMRKCLSSKAFKRWRKRVQGRATKHVKKCLHTPKRFEGPW